MEDKRGSALPEVTISRRLQLGKAEETLREGLGHSTSPSQVTVLPAAPML